MELSPRSMAALWMSGFEDDDAQQRCGELCVFEIFGKDLGPGERRRPRSVSASRRSATRP